MKKYNGEKAVISLTSWTARIDTVHKTIENLLTMCPGFHICLTLSLEEFPNGVFSLPRSLTDLEKANKFEIIWVKKNYKAFKKVLFAIMKYPQVPVISADDDCIYTENYAENLYQSWESEGKKNEIYGYSVDRNTPPFSFMCGALTLYPPNCFSGKAVKIINDRILSTDNDDLFLGALAHKMEIKLNEVSKERPFTSHDETDPIHEHGMMPIPALRICIYEIDKYFSIKGIISITSHPKRIRTLSLTLLSLLMTCPNFKIVVVLSREEFNSMNEIPYELGCFFKNGWAELIFVDKNWTTFKKFLPTMEIYPDLPIITADDGCIYTNNYAEALYQEWLKDKSKIVSFNRFEHLGIEHGGGGSGILFPPGCFKHPKLTDAIIETKHDDFYYGCLAKMHGLQWKFINEVARDCNFVHLDHTEIGVGGAFWDPMNEIRLCKIIMKELGL